MGIWEKKQVLIPSLIHRQRSRPLLSHFAVSFHHQPCTARPLSGPSNRYLGETHQGSLGYIARGLPKSESKRAKASGVVPWYDLSYSLVRITSFKTLNKQEFFVLATKRFGAACYLARVANCVAWVEDS